MGGGGGGGARNHHRSTYDKFTRGRGGGAGLQTSFHWSLGGGAGGGVEISTFQPSGEIRKFSESFGYEKDDIPPSHQNREGTAKDVIKLRKYIKLCYEMGGLRVFGGGGSGGGSNRKEDHSSSNVRYYLEDEAGCF